MSEFLEILTHARRLKASVKELSVAELKDVYEKLGKIVAEREEEANAEAEANAERIAKIAELQKMIESAGLSLDDLGGVTWIREGNLGNGGPTDLVFKLENGDTLAIEFKLRGTATAYKKDIIKLCKITQPNTSKIFCALIDVFDSKLPDDGRQSYIESMAGYKVTSLLIKSFKTKQNWYQSKTSCVVGAWSVSLNETDELNRVLCDSCE